MCVICVIVCVSLPLLWSLPGAMGHGERVLKKMRMRGGVKVFNLSCIGSYALNDTSVHSKSQPKSSAAFMHYTSRLNSTEAQQCHIIESVWGVKDTLMSHLYFDFWCLIMHWKIQYLLIYLKVSLSIGTSNLSIYFFDPPLSVPTPSRTPSLFHFHFVHYFHFSCVVQIQIS